MEAKKKKGIITKFEDTNIIFEFITPPQTREINEIKEHLFFKEKQKNYLRKDINILNISSQLDSSIVKSRIEEISMVSKPYKN